ncbi:DUF6098 family protein [Labedaea rhizosphaerae]|uniref:Uncharacterized protein n=1 Tax=Labedaea rhizosphaerae TaxID=598644 RepID=A0A4R6SHU5_LABRH|nr:DUF6098 family protein [Labedaea rhizosphaerae]TDQ00439.1 hypothetical protein EV186_102300 [Labedaea rhizosphaerae]
MTDALPELHSLDALVTLVTEADNGANLYVRWSRGPALDEQTSSRDELTGVPLPGLSANPLRVEQWWGDRSLRLWVARRLHDYRHLREIRGADVRPWVARGREVARGPDNEPLIEVCRPVAWIHPDVLDEVDATLTEHRADWGPLDRTPS